MNEVIDVAKKVKDESIRKIVKDKEEQWIIQRQQLEEDLKHQLHTKEKEWYEEKKLHEERLEKPEKALKDKTENLIQYLNAKRKGMQRVRNILEVIRHAKCFKELDSFRLLLLFKLVK